MFIVIAFMFAGILIGYLLRNIRIKYINHTITILIWALLLFLGMEVGKNKDIIKALPIIGAEAISITIAALFGSLFAAWILWKRFSGKGDKKS